MTHTPLPAATRVGRVKLQVSDLARSLDYYQRVIGLRPLDQSPTHAVLAPQASQRPLVELHERRGARAVPRRGLLGLYHFAILLPDRAALGRFLSHVAQLDVPVGMSDHLVSEAIYLQDPDNLGIEVYADRPRAAWSYQNGQLAMATDPLDADAVIAAGQGQSWGGAPAETTMGHLHLHVGDIAQAERFYHEGIGLDKTVSTYPGALFMSAGGYHHHLGVNTWARGAPPASEDDARLLEWELILPSESDVAGVSDRLRSRGVSVAPDAVVADPWGTRLRLTSAPA